jgi:hypothetical protein
VVTEGRDVVLELAIMPALQDGGRWLEPERGLFAPPFNSTSRLQFPVYKERGLRVLACFANLRAVDVAVER